MWEGVGDRTKRQYIYPHSIGHNRVSFPFSWAAQPEAQEPTLCWILAFSTASCNQRVWSPKLTDFLSSPSYIIVQSPTQYLWNGMFDRHLAEVNVMQITGHSLPVHQSKTIPRDFNLSHIVSQAPLRDFFPQLPSECITSAVFGMSYLAGSKVNIQQWVNFSLLTLCHT